MLLFDTNRERLVSAQQQYMAAMLTVRLDPKVNKVVVPSDDSYQQVECLGMMIDCKELSVGVSVEKMITLIDDTRSLIARGSCSGLELGKLVGRWTWSMLARRPSLSVFSAVYRQVLVSGPVVFSIWPSVRRELLLIVDIAPLLVSFISQRWCNTVMVTDASSLGHGVCTHRVNNGDIDGLITTGWNRLDRMSPPSPRCHDWISRSRWRTIISRRWYRLDEHINCYEIRAVAAALKWHINHSHDTIGYRLLILSDSQVAIGSIMKGRSSSFRLLVPLRGIAALCLATGTHLDLRYVPTDINPADAPSRSF